MYIYSLKYHTIVTIYEKYIPQLGAKIIDTVDVLKQEPKLMFSLFSSQPRCCTVWDRTKYTSKYT